MWKLALDAPAITYAGPITPTGDQNESKHSPFIGQPDGTVITGALCCCRASDVQAPTPGSRRGFLSSLRHADRRPLAKVHLGISS